MKILFCGDVVGSSGRAALADHLPDLRRDLQLDFVVVNGENAAGGFGITGAIAESFFDLGVDAITTGNHVWDQREVATVLVREPRLLRPVNFPPASTPGNGMGIYESARGEKVLVVNVMGRLFMDPLDDPFAALDAIFAEHVLGESIDAALVDVHAETTSEKQAVGHFLDGRATLVVGSHTHVPTADGQILPGGTAYQTDAGMCGDYDSVIGSDKGMWVQKFRAKMPVGRITPSKGDGTLCATLVETEPRSGLARSIEPVVLGARLQERRPE
ncbi:MAG: TIGR00282 family metallophosphoesterase [Alphaproteobacteria bacterium]|jgi:hypothetical protein|nr:TIGR00282 family metallophosphoesterase [Alphaproteobacteria bacterium]